MIHLMPSYASLGRTESCSGFYTAAGGLFDRETILSQRTSREEPSMPRHESPPSAQPSHSSFLIDDILGKKQREREERRTKERSVGGCGNNDSRRSDIDDDMNRSTDTDSELDRSRVEYEHSEARRCERELDRERHVLGNSQQDSERQRERDRELRELQCNRFRQFSGNRERIERDGIVDRHPHHPQHSHTSHNVIHHAGPATISNSKPLPSPPVSTTTILSEIPRPTPINPAAIQTGALTTPTIYKPMPTIYDQSALSQAAFMNPHLSTCHTSLMRQMCGNFGAIGSLPGYSRHDYPNIFENQYNAFSKSK